MLAVARIDAFRRKPDVKIMPPAHAGLALEDRNADFLGGARIHGRLEHHGRPGLHVTADQRGGAGQRREIRLVGAVDRGRYRDDDGIGGIQARRIGRECELRRRSQVGSRDFPAGIDAAAVMRDLGGGQIEAERPAPLAECDCQWQTNVPESDYCNDCFCMHFIGSDPIFANCIIFNIARKNRYFPAKVHRLSNGNNNLPAMTGLPTYTLWCWLGT